MAAVIFSRDAKKASSTLFQIRSPILLSATSGPPLPGVLDSHHVDVVGDEDDQGGNYS